MNKNLPPSASSFDELVLRFDYDRTAPLDVSGQQVEQKEDVSVHDVSYASLEGGRIPAFWLVPPGEGPFPGVIYVHPAPGDRSTFLEEAVLLGKQGLASLLVEAPWAQAETFGPNLAEPEAALAAFTGVVKDLRQAVDFLLAQPQIDPARIGYVGHSFGALVGGVLSGVEHRIRAFVLMSGTGSFTDSAVLNMPFLQGDALDRYARVVAPIDPVYYVAQAAPSPLFFQFGLEDDYYSRETFQRFAAAGSEPKRIDWYPTGHYFQNQDALKDRLEWLKTHLL